MQPKLKMMVTRIKTCAPFFKVDSYDQITDLIFASIDSDIFSDLFKNIYTNNEKKDVASASSNTTNEIPKVTALMSE